jgi:hypothetical protein
MSQRYRIRWEIDFEAASALDAAWLALKLQRDRRSVATVFEVVDEAGRFTTYDLQGRPEARGSGGRAPVGAVGLGGE